VRHAASIDAIWRSVRPENGVLPMYVMDVLLLDSECRCRAIEDQIYGDSASGITRFGRQSRGDPLQEFIAGGDGKGGGAALDELQLTISQS
jgi:hypothetical protein